MGENLIVRIHGDFTYHKPPAEIGPVFVEIRNKAKELALMIADKVPAGREQSTALTRLEEAILREDAPPKCDTWFRLPFRDPPADWQPEDRG